LFSGRVTHGGYGGPEVKFSSILGEPAVLVGGQGGWIIDHRFVLGAAGYGVATQHDVPTETQIGGYPSTLEMGYGGVRGAYVFWPEKIVHFDIALLVGGGGLVVRTTDRVRTAQGDRFQVGRDDAFFIMEPALELEVNVTRFMRIAASGSYRYISGVEAPGLSYSKLSMPAGGVAFRFGKF
jgi:hypothetical protein